MDKNCLSQQLKLFLQELATDVINKYPPGVERIGTIEHHMKNTGNTNRETFELLLGYLVAQGAALKQGDVVKLGNCETNNIIYKIDL